MNPTLAQAIGDSLVTLADDTVILADQDIAEDYAIDNWAWRT